MRGSRGYWRICLLGAVLLAPAVVAASLAWACIPGSSVTVRPDSGLPGATATVAGSGFPPGTVEVRWDTSDGPVVALATGPSFSTQFRIPEAATRGVHYLVATGSAPGGAFVSTPTVFHVVSPSLALTPSSGAAGSTSSATGSGFAPGTVELRWGSASGPLIGTADGPAFSFPVTIPRSTSGSRTIVAVGRGPAGESADLASAGFQVTAGPAPSLVSSPSPLAPPADTRGPALSRAALTALNGTRTVSRSGQVRLLCGRFTEAGVTGVCGARSARRLVQVKATEGGLTRRSVVLRLGSRRFRAASPRPVAVKFRLTRSNLKMLKAARKIRMLGSVAARDSSGNVTRTSFRFTLKAPRRGRG